MEIRIRHIKAVCECGSSEFLASREPTSSLEEMACAKCGRVRTYGELLNEIGEEAMRQANDALRRLKEERAQGRR